MTTRLLVRSLTIASLLLVLVLPNGIAAQEEDGADQVVSANPFGLLLEFFNAEYERKAGDTSSFGVGGSFFENDNDDYVNLDVFWRYYPQAQVFDGWAFGAKLGLTHVDEGTYGGFGFDVNRGWLLGADDNFYVGVGFGLKRLYGVDGDDFGLRYIPTIRLVNIGIAF